MASSIGKWDQTCTAVSTKVDLALIKIDIANPFDLIYSTVRSVKDEKRLAVFKLNVIRRSGDITTQLAR